MDNNTKVERATVDGRRAEIHTLEHAVEGATQRVTEYFEEIVPFETKKRVTERIVPVVMERLTEQMNGSQISKTVEKVTGDDLALRLTQLHPAQPSITKKDVEDAVRNVINEKGLPAPTPKIWHWLKGKSGQTQDVTPPVPVPAPAPVPLVESVVFGYILTIALAIIVGWIVWNLFIR